MGVGNMLARNSSKSALPGTCAVRYYPAMSVAGKRVGTRHGVVRKTQGAGQDDMEQQTATAPGSVELFCRDAGRGAAPVLILHGLFGASANLGAVARHLQAHDGQGYRTLSCDLRNHGRSPHVAHMDYASTSADVLGALDRHGIERCAVLGHSMGGKVAMQLALDHPDRVAALMVADIAPVVYASDRHQAVFSALQSVPLADIEDRREADAALAEHLSDPGVRQFLLASLYQRQGAFRWRFNLDALYANRENLSLAPSGEQPYAGPVLFIKGANSDYIGPDSGTAIKALFPAARLHVVRDADHWLHAEKPRAFNAVVSRFVERFYPA